jgi:monoamine oxidase
MKECHQDEDKAWDVVMSLSVEEVLKEQGFSLDAISYVRMRMVPDEGVELAEVPASQLQEGAWEDNYPEAMFRLEGGNDSLVKAFASTLTEPVRTGSVVKTISQSETGVAIGFSRQSQQDGTQQTVEDHVQARFVVCAVPLQPLRSIVFTPSLSEPRKDAIASVSYAPVCKVLVQFRERYWRELGWNGNMTTEHPLCVWNATEHQTGETGVLCFYVTGSATHQLRELPGKKKEAFLLEVLQSQGLLPDDCEVVGYEVFDWQQECFSGGGWSVYPLGDEEELAELLVEPEGRVFFAGEHLPARTGSEADEDLIDTVESALSSGIHAAKCILREVLREQRAARAANMPSADDPVDAVESPVFLEHLRAEGAVHPKDKPVSDAGVRPPKIPSTEPVGSESDTSSEQKETTEKRGGPVDGSIFEVIGPGSSSQS